MECVQGYRVAYARVSGGLISHTTPRILIAMSAMNSASQMPAAASAAVAAQVMDEKASAKVASYPLRLVFLLIAPKLDYYFLVLLSFLPLL